MKRNIILLFTALCFSGIAASPLSATTYIVPETGSRLIGSNVQHYVQRDGRSLESIATEYDVGLLALMQANPSVDPFLPAPGMTLIIPQQILLPDVPREGIIVNLSEMRLYFFPKNQNTVHVYPVGIGQIDDDTVTPVMKTTIVQKREDPTWTPTANIRKRYLEQGIVLPAVVPAGEDNPMGHHALRLGAYGGVYLIHGTNADFGIGMRVSSGCIRLRNTDIEALFKAVPIGTVVRILNEPVKVSAEPDGAVYVEIHQPLSESLSDDPKTRPIIQNASVKKRLQNQAISVIAFDKAMENRTGLPTVINEKESI